MGCKMVSVADNDAILEAILKYRETGMKLDTAAGNRRVADF
jgi:hypothetical protein